MCLQRLFCLISRRPWDVRWNLLDVYIQISSKHLLETFVVIQVCSALHWWCMWKGIRTSVYNVLYSCLVLNKYETCLPTFAQFPSVRVYGNPLNGSLLFTRVETDRRNHLKWYCVQMNKRLRCGNRWEEHSCHKTCAVQWNNVWGWELE
jgi:hypothetical protein